jgi:hypothetical protein
MVSFRMYPYGIKSELQGFGKGAVLSMNTLWPGTTVLIAFWLIGLLVTGLATPFLLAFLPSVGVYFLAGYVFYTAQIIYFLRYTGRYGLLMPLLHPLSSLFFIVIMLYSLYQVTFKGSVSWKGRQVPVGERRTL